MKKINKVLLGVGALGSAVAPVVAVVSCASLGDEKTYGFEGLYDKGNLVGAGSTSVKPIIDVISGELKGKLNYTGGGSGKGLSSQAATPKPEADFGVTSSTKFPTDGNGAAVAWGNANIRTLTWAKDAIGISLNLPNGIKIIDNARPKIDANVLAHGYDGQDVTWKQLLTNEVSSSSDLDKNVLFMGRTSGKSASGTADGFMHALEKFAVVGSQTEASFSGITFGAGNTLADFENHTNNKIQKTDEANAAALTALKNTDGSVTYLSLGYAMANEETNKMVVAEVVGETGTETAKVHQDWSIKSNLKTTLAAGYNWTRPFNMIYDVTNEKAIAFARLLWDTKTAQLIDDQNFVQLTDKERVAQIGDSSTDAEFKKSDAQLSADASNVDKGFVDKGAKDTSGAFTSHLYFGLKVGL